MQESTRFLVSKNESESKLSKEQSDRPRLDQNTFDNLDRRVDTAEVDVQAQIDPILSKTFSPSGDADQRLVTYG